MFVSVSHEVQVLYHMILKMRSRDRRSFETVVGCWDLGFLKIAP